MSMAMTRPPSRVLLRSGRDVAAAVPTCSSMRRLRALRNTVSTCVGASATSDAAGSVRMMSPAVILPPSQPFDANDARLRVDRN